MRIICVLFGMLMLSGCYSLTHVQQFTTEATETLAQGLDLEPTFYQVCQQRQQMQLLQEGTLSRTFREGCQLQQQADSTARQIHIALMDYLVGLHQLSASGQSGPSLAPLGTALQSHPFLEEHADAVSAYQELAQLSLTGITERSRRKKARQFIAEANQPLQTLLSAYEYVIGDLLVESIQRQQQMYYPYTRELLDSAHSFIEKKGLIEEYMDRSIQYDEQQQRLLQFVEVLKTIGEGHEQLYQQRADLQQQAAIEALYHYTSQLQRMQILSNH